MATTYICTQCGYALTPDTPNPVNQLRNHLRPHYIPNRAPQPPRTMFSEHADIRALSPLATLAPEIRYSTLRYTPRHAARPLTAPQYVPVPF